MAYKYRFVMIRRSLTYVSFVFYCRANESDDVMVSAPEIKRIALAIEEELFAYYGEVNTKYKHKFRTMITHLKDPKNTVNKSQYCVYFE